MKRIIGFLLIILGAFAAGGWLGYSYSRAVYIQSPVVTVTTFKDSTIYKIIKTPFKVSEQLFLTDTVFIDTSKVINDYFYTRNYADTLVNDSNIAISYAGTVFKNSLQNIEISYKFNRAFSTFYTSTVPPQIQKASLRFYVGGQLQVDKLNIDPFIIGGVVVNTYIVGCGYAPFTNRYFASFAKVF